MLFSIACILLLGMFMGWICKRLKLPSLIGMILTGIILGPYLLNLIDSSILNISSDLRRIALIIILIRAGLSLNIHDLKKVGRPAILMCFVPACFEIIGMVLLAPTLLGISILDAAIMGAVVGAVSPAVIVPKMLKLINEGYGVKHCVPQLLLAGASVDDVFVIIIFTTFTGLAQEHIHVIQSLVSIPISIVTGILIGVLIGFLLAILFKAIHIRDTAKVIIVLCISFMVVVLEDQYTAIVPFSGYIAIMCISITLQKKYEVTAIRLSRKFDKLWVGAEIILFVLVGAAINLNYAFSAGIRVFILILCVLIFRIAGVYVCLLKTNLTIRERCFCMLSYMPKATVQAAIGGIPLAMGLSCGEIVLTLAVLAILITAPLGAFLIDHTYQILLEKDDEFIKKNSVF